MSSIIENKQLVHIGTEIVILAGLSYYFNNKNVKLLESIEVINLRLNQQEEMIQKQEMMIKKLMIKVEQNHSQRQPSIEPKKISKKQNIVSFEEKTDKINIVRIEDDDEEETESALDDEIEEELNELKTK